MDELLFLVGTAALGKFVKSTLLHCELCSYFTYEPNIHIHQGKCVHAYLGLSQTWRSLEANKNDAKISWRDFKDLFRF